MSGSDQAVGKLRFFVDADLDNVGVRVQDKALIAQWRKVLRLKKGSVVELVNRDGREGVARIEVLGSDVAELTVVSVRDNEREPARQVTLYCAMLKRENFEWVAQKVVEVGVSRLVPMTTERTVKLGFKRERLEAIMREAAEQSGRGKIPSLADPMTFTEAVTDSAGINERYFFDAAGEALVPTGKPRAIAGFIGPEGGWSEAERICAAQNAIKTVGLGPRILRAETAAVIATYLLCR